MTGRLLRGPGAIRVIVDPVPAVESVCVAIWFAAGSRDERPDERGAAHLLEHLVIRGEPRTGAVRAAVSAAGGQVGGVTTPEYTCLHFRVPRADWRAAFVALAAAFRAPVTAAYDEELPVILAEIRDKDHDPRRRIHELALADLLGDHPLAHDPHGRPEDVAALEPATVEAFRRRAHVDGACLVVISGNIDTSEVIEAVHEELALPPGGPPVRRPLAPDRAATGWRTHPAAMRRAHLVMSFLVPGQWRDELNILNYLLGRTQDSFIWRHVRDELGLAYDVYTYRSVFTELGVFSVYASCAPGDVEPIHDAVLDAMSAACDEVDAARVRSVARALAGSLALGLEATHMRANWLGRMTLGTGRVPDYRESSERLSRISAAEIRDLLTEMLWAGRCAVTVLGPAEEHGPGNRANP